MFIRFFSSTPEKEKCKNVIFVKQNDEFNIYTYVNHYIGITTHDTYITINYHITAKYVLSNHIGDRRFR